MKIGLVRRGFSSTGGAENYLRRLADALEAAGHAPVLFAGPDWPRAAWPAHRARVEIAGGGPRAFADGVARCAERSCERLFSLERLWRCDCFRAGDGVHRAWLERRGRREPAWRRWWRGLNRKHRETLALEHRLFAAGGATSIIANSRLVRDEIVRWYGTPPARIAVVHNGLPPASFDPPAAGERARSRSRLGLREDDYAILFAGTGWERKGLAHLLAAVQRLPAGLPWRVLVAGRGDPRAYRFRAGRQARARTTFLGPVGDMRALYAAADVFVAPTWYDPFSNACLEALASGLPVLTTAANGFAEVIEAGVQGEVLEQEESDGGTELAARLLEWAEPRKREEARPTCRSVAATYTMERNVAETLRVLLEGP